MEPKDHSNDYDWRWEKWFSQLWYRDLREKKNQNVNTKLNRKKRKQKKDKEQDK